MSSSMLAVTRFLAMLWLLFLAFPIDRALGAPTERALGLGLTYNGPDSLPLLTLPYATYQAASYNDTTDIYLFANIRFAAPPLGELRWAAPAPPLPQSGIQDGSIGGTCFQETLVPSNGSEIVPTSPFPQTEDCLFLDVFVPGDVIRNANASDTPVLFWIYGGSYTSGSKDIYGGEFLLQTSNNSIIFVRTNYRLGAFGWLAGPDFLSEGGVANVGLLDQDAALEWTKSYISLLGGDPTQITVMGESAGGGSIMHHITANGGTTTPAFSRAILQSPAFLPQYDNTTLNTQFADFSIAAECNPPSLTCLRNLSSSALENTNILVISKAPYGEAVFGPAVDGTYVRDLPGRELLAGHFAQNIQVMVAHNSDEGFLFTDQELVTEAQVDAWIEGSFPNATAAVLQELVTLYPPPSLLNPERYETLLQFSRVDDLVGEALVVCNCLYLARAFGNQTYNYRFSFPPGFHAIDLLFTFYPFGLIVDGVNTDEIVPVPFAQGLQSYLISFAKHGDPNVERRAGTVEFPIFGPEKNIVDAGDGVFHRTRDNQLPDDRCAFWQAAPYT